MSELDNIIFLDTKVSAGFPSPADDFVSFDLKLKTNFFLQNLSISSIHELIYMNSINKQYKKTKFRYW